MGISNYTLLYIIISFFCLFTFFTFFLRKISISDTFSKIKSTKSDWLFSGVFLILPGVVYIIFDTINLLYQLELEIFRKEGILEVITTVFLFIAAFVSFFFFKKSKLLWLGILSLLAYLFLVMEEISWGQTYLGWDTPDTYKEYNYQNETNLHNLFNPIMKVIYLQVWLTVLFFLIIGFAKEFKKMLPNKIDSAIDTLLPCSERVPLMLLIIVLIIQCIFIRHTEPSEFIFSLASVFFFGRSCIK